MKKILSILILSILLIGCDDGDIIVTSFDFEDANLETCGTVGNYVFFKINNNSQESISLRLNTTNELFLETATVAYTLDGTSNFVNYRKYDANLTSTYFCSSIPPTTPLVTVDYIGSSGVARLFTETTLDDNDTLDEVIDITIDTDEDGIPDFYDFDDDGDNVPTAAELDTENLDGDDNPLTNPKDTDGDSIPDYLDDDDDGDGVLTRYEENISQDLNPANDITDSSVGPDYLNAAVATSIVADQYRAHSYSLKSDIRLQLENLVLINANEQITQEFLDLGEKTNVLNANVTVTPAF
jgi:hypothetical protein